MLKVGSFGFLQNNAGAVRVSLEVIAPLMRFINNAYWIADYLISHGTVIAAVIVKLVAAVGMGIFGDGKAVIINGDTGMLLLAGGMGALGIAHGAPGRIIVNMGFQARIMQLGAQIADAEEIADH